MIKVSFDFDGTLSLEYVQEFAKKLLDRNIEIWIVTAREEGVSHNLDLYKVASELQIPNERIIFTNYEDKYPKLNLINALFHLDDDVIELSMIKDYSKTIPICHLEWGVQYGGRFKWREIILKLINESNNSGE